MAEGFLQSAADGPGKRVRSVEVDVIQPDTSVKTVFQQVITVADRYGSLHSMDDAFGRHRVVEPETIFDLKHLYGKQPLFVDEATTGAGSTAHDDTNKLVTLSVTGGTDQAIRQTRMRFNYQSGKSQLFMFTGLFTQQANVRKRVGCFDGADGVFLEVTGAAVTWNVMKGGVVTETAAQSGWNLDKLDGTGPSGLTLDLAACQILLIDFQWLGVGAVRVGFFHDGLVHYVHRFRHANVSGFTVPYMNNPNLPIRYQIDSTGGAGSMSHICNTVISEGGQEETGLVYSLDMSVVPFTVPATGAQVLLAIRLKADNLSAVVRLRKITVLFNGVGNWRWSLLLNPTVAGAALSFSDVANTSVQQALGAAANLATAGFQFDSGYVGTQTRTEGDVFNTLLRLGSSIAGVADVIALCAEVYTGGTVATLASMTLQEQM